MWSVPDGRELRRAKLDEGSFLLQMGQNAFLTSATVGQQQVLRLWPLQSGEPRLVGSMKADQPGPMAASGPVLAYARGGAVYVRSLEDWSTPPRMIQTLEADIRSLAISRDGALVATSDGTREIRTFLTSAQRPRPDRILHAPGACVGLGYDTAARWLYALNFERGYPAVALFDQMSTRAADPLVLHKGDTSNLGGFAFDPSGHWLATTHGTDVAFWPLLGPRTHVFRAQTGLQSILFAPDGSRLLSLGVDRSLRAWSLKRGGETSVLIPPSLQPPFFRGMALDASGRILAVSGTRGHLSLMRLDDGSMRTLPGFPEVSLVGKPAFADDGRFVAAGLIAGPAEEKVIRVWDVETGGVRTFGPLAGAGPGLMGGVTELRFAGQDRLVTSVSGTGLVSVDLQSGASRVMTTGRVGEFVISHDGRFAIATSNQETTKSGSRPILRVRLDDGTAQPVSSHGTEVTAVALDPSDSLIATGSADGTIRVGRVSGEEPHILLGQLGSIYSIAFSPDGRWIASAGEAFAIHVWPVPDISRPPLHRRPHDDLLSTLRNLTNLRAVSEPSSSTGYTLIPGPFPGWAKVPEW
jgi:WD40 repeat protein